MRIKNAKGYALDVLVCMPLQPRASVVLCHGFLSSKDNGTHRDLTEKLHRHGIATLCFDMTGHGRSEGVLFEAGLGDFYSDIAIMIDYAHATLPPPLGIYGASLSGNIALLYAAQESVDAVAVKCPMVNPASAWKNYQLYKLSQLPQSMQQKLVNVEKFVEGLPPLYSQLPPCRQPTLVVGALYDNLVESREILELVQKIGVNEYTLFPADHDFSEPEQHAMMTTLIAGWFAKTLTHFK